ncbi:MAG TPA: CFI-box-CTERM domain-containing protein [Candidatus Angelobacter sp.]|jgi:tetratricopeptide (TPR) repeat protein|nr:CFI-box-CTERM domain-containing protein [Candidatus Angelobacter sp.]
MPIEPKCGNCKHKQSRSICGNPQSPHFKEQVESTWHCGFYLESPAQELLKEASLKSLADDSTAGMEDLKKALQHGLPEDDELFARFVLAEGYVDIAVASKARLSAEQLVASPEFLEALNQAEQAVLIDRQGQYQYFSEPLNRARLRPIDEFYNLAGLVLKDSKGIDSAIAYLQQKIGLLSFLSTTPLLLTTFTLGSLYLEKGQNESAAACSRNILHSEPVLPGDENKNEPAIRQGSEQKLNQIESKPASGAQSGCFIATAVYGSQDTDELSCLRQFRDRFLAERVSGRMLIRAYNVAGPVLAAFIRRSETRRAIARRLLVKPAAELAKAFLAKRRK